MCLMLAFAVRNFWLSPQGDCNVQDVQFPCSQSELLELESYLLELELVFAQVENSEKDLTEYRERVLSCMMGKMAQQKGTASNQEMKQMVQACLR